MPDYHPAQNIREVLAAIIEGKIVKRIKHDLVYEGSDLTIMFIEELEKQQYISTSVARVNVQPGERVPAFLINGTTAFFGWVFWEQFTAWKIRKLWGSVIKNSLGDWKIQIPENRSTVIYAREKAKIEMDIDHPPEF